MDKDIEDLLEKQRQQNLLLGHQIAPHTEQIREMMELNISLPLIRGWLEEKKAVTVTLQTLRNFVVKTFGQDHYSDFVTHNGWLKTKRLEDKKRRASDAVVTDISSVPVVAKKDTELVRPSGISNAAWSDMQVKHRAAQRNNN